MISEQQIVIRLLAAAILGGLVGIEREMHQQPAGLRTHMILAIGSALAMCLSIDLAMQFQPLVPNGDPARLAAQVISGIGFLGAGAIFRYGATIKGLTTATSLWTVAIVGLVVGAGHFFSAGIATALLLGALSVLDQLEKRFLANSVTRTINIRIQDRQGLVEELRQVFNDLGFEAKSLGFSKDTQSNELHIRAIAKVPRQQNADQVIARLSNLQGIRQFEFQ
ncbi:MAG: MgtC/SapB family protein [Chloroflexi bacterium]|nr:MgtC/SapB family protein [Chloroflexota bacterium]